MKYLSNKSGFLGIDNKLNFKEKVVVVPFGLEKTVSYGGGTKNGPREIIKASHQVELYDEELLCEPYKKIGIKTLKPFKIDKNIKKALKKMSDINEEILNKKLFPMTFGGEHSITPGCIAPFAKKHKKNNLIQIHDSVKDLEAKENQYGFSEQQTYVDFAKRVNAIKADLCNFINEENSKGKTIYAYGASTKGNTFLQFCNLNDKLIKKVADRDPEKLGKRTIGTNLLIISEEQARKEKPDYFLILPWHFAEFFKEREKKFLDEGGKFIVPIPKFQIISNQ